MPPRRCGQPFSDVPAGSTLYFPRGRYPLGSDVTVPRTLTVVADRGAVLEPGDGATLTVHGTVEAGLHRVFGGDGRTVGTFGGQTVAGQWFGAVGDGVTDDAPAIRAAVDGLWAGGGGTLYLAAATYLLRDTVGDPSAVGSHHFITARSDVHIIGDGDATVLKAADGLNATLKPGYNFIFQASSLPADRVDNASYRHLKFDGNGANNLQLDVAAGQPKAKNAAIAMYRGSNIVVDHVTVVNNPGRQCFMFGSNAKPQTFRNVRITNCLVDTFGAGVAGNTHQNDHSVVYVQSDGAVMTGNTFVQPELGVSGGYGTGLEIHSCNAVASNNLMKNLNLGLNVVATVTDMANLVVTDNVVQNVNRALAVWCWAGQSMKDVTISGNQFVQGGLGAFDAYPYDYGFLDVSVQVQNQVTNLAVVDNTFTYAVPTAAVRGTVGLVLGCVRDATIRGNRFAGFTGPAIQIQKSFVKEPASPAPSTLVIDDNTIDDCGRNTNPAKRAGINLVSRENLALLRIRGNVMWTSSSDALVIGIRSAVTAAHSQVDHNMMQTVDTPYEWPSTVVGQSLVLEHSGPGDPTSPGIPASVGSVWVNPVDGKVWDKDAGNDGAGWVLRP